MGTVIASEKNPQKMPAAMFYFARAATVEGAEALAPAGRQQALDYVKRAYKGYHGSDDGFGDLVALAKAQPAPPVTVTRLLDQKLCQKASSRAEGIPV